MSELEYLHTIFEGICTQYLKVFAQNFEGICTKYLKVFAQNI